MKTQFPIAQRLGAVTWWIEWQPGSRVRSTLPFWHPPKRRIPHSDHTDIWDDDLGCAGCPDLIGCGNLPLRNSCVTPPHTCPDGEIPGSWHMWKALGSHKTGARERPWSQCQGCWICFPGASSRMCLGLCELCAGFWKVRLKPMLFGDPQSAKTDTWMRNFPDLFPESQSLYLANASRK